MGTGSSDPAQRGLPPNRTEDDALPLTASAVSAPNAARAWWQHQDRRPQTVLLQESPASRVAFRALLAFTAILLLSPQIWFPVLGTLRIAFLAAGLAIAAHVTQRMAGQQPVAPFFPEIGSAAAEHHDL